MKADDLAIDVAVRVESPARKRVLDDYHLMASVDVIVVAAMEAGVDVERLVSDIRDRWKLIGERIVEAESIEVALYVGPPSERPL